MINTEQLMDPNWEEFNKGPYQVKDWRTYIPNFIQEKWDDISVESRLMMYEVAYNVALKETLGKQ